VNLCLSFGYSTIKWFASGYFFRRGSGAALLLVISSVNRVQLCFSSVKLSNNGLLLCVVISFNVHSSPMLCLILLALVLQLL
jgi:hypothetical protein